MSDQNKRFDKLEADIAALTELVQQSVDSLKRASSDQMQHLGDIERYMDRVANRVTSLETKSTLHRHTASGRSSLHPVELIPDGKELHAPQRRWRKLVRGRD